MRSSSDRNFRSLISGWRTAAILYEGRSKGRFFRLSPMALFIFLSASLSVSISRTLLKWHSHGRTNCRVGFVSDDICSVERLKGCKIWITFSARAYSLKSRRLYLKALILSLAVGLTTREWIAGISDVSLSNIFIVEFHLVGVS